MKKGFLAFLFLVSTTSFADVFTTEDRANLTVLKMALEIQLESVEEATVVIQKNAEAYKELSKFSLAQKRELRALNCANIKSSIGVNMLFVSGAFEMSRSALSKIEISDEGGATFQQNYLGYIKNAKEASSNCKDIEKSSKLLQNGLVQLETATAILTELLPNLVD